MSPDLDFEALASHPDPFSVARCDACGARSQIIVNHMDWLMHLALCGHHGRKAWDGFPDGFEIIGSEEFWISSNTESEHHGRTN